MSAQRRKKDLNEAGRRSSEPDAALPGGGPAAKRRRQGPQTTTRWVLSNLHYSGFFTSMLLFIGGGAYTQWGEPTRRPVVPDDPTYSLPRKGTKVPITYVLITCLVSAAAILIGEFMDRSRGHSRAMRIRHGVQLSMDMLTSSFFTVGITMFIKMATGEPRPDLLSGCPDAVDCPPDQLQAFPSGHTAFSFATSAYAGYYLFWAFYIRGLPPLSEWHWHAVPTLVQYEDGRLEVPRSVANSPAPSPRGAAPRIQLPVRAESPGPAGRPAAPAAPAPGTLAVPQTHAVPLPGAGSPAASEQHLVGTHYVATPAGSDRAMAVSPMPNLAALAAAQKRFAKLPTFWSVMGDEGWQMLRLLALLVPQATAAFVGISRYLNNRHSLLDITAGAFIGAFVAFFVFLRTVLLMERAPRSPVPDLRFKMQKAQAAAAAAAAAAAMADERPYGGSDAGSFRSSPPAGGDDDDGADIEMASPVPSRPAGAGRVASNGLLN